MKKIFTTLAFTIMAMNVTCSFAQSRVASAQAGASTGMANLWTAVTSGAPSASLMPFHPRNYKVYTLSETMLKLQMFGLSSDPQQGMVVTLPMPDGTFRNFKVWQSSMMAPELAAKYPDIKTFTGEAVDDHRITAKLDFTLFGFHAMIFESGNTSFIDPYDNYHDGYYMVHYKKDETRAVSNRMVCQLHSHEESANGEQPMETEQSALPRLDHRSAHNELRVTNGWIARTYTLALSADHFYCQAATGLATPTIAQCLSAMTTSMNRINGVYNREFSVQMNFGAHEDTLIWPTATGSINGADPFNAIDANPNSCLTTNQTTCDTRIGSANYGLGHVFTTGGGGLSALGVVCEAGQKAQSVTGSPTPVGDGYDIDYVAHEMGHEFGSDHTFNNNIDGSCATNAVSSVAYEPASGGTIMDYAGICSPDDIQYHSDPYFSASSLLQIVTQLKATEETCGIHTVTGNHVDTLPHFSATYTIPYKTPFELTGPTAVDSGAADTAQTYQLLQWNLGDFGKRLNQTFVKGPIFRSFDPVYNPTRIFPAISMVLSGVLSNAGTEGAEGEKAPDTARYLTFKMVARDIMSGYGCFHFPDDTFHIVAWQTGVAGAYQGFKVTSQGTTGIVYLGGSTQTVTWNVVGTSGAPVNATNVDIFLSTDGGYTWPYTIGTFPNNGTASVTLPNPATSSTTTRIKVKGSGNVFFNINSNNFTLNNNPVSTLPITGTFTVCAGSTTALTDATSGGTWTSSTPLVGTVGSSSGVVTGIAGGTTTISYIASSGTVTAIVTVNTAPVVSPISGSATVCIGQTTPLTDATGAGVWNSGSANASVSTSGVVTGNTAGTATISYSVTNSCGTTVVTKVITVSAGGVVGAISGTLHVCQGGTTTLTDATPAGTWSSSITAVATIGTGGLVTGATAGTTIISYGVVTGGCTSFATATFTVNALPTAVIAPAGTATICPTGSEVFTATTGAGYTYQWQTGVANIPGATSTTYTTSGAGTYRVVVSSGGCTATSASTTLVVSSGYTVAPSVSITGSLGTTLCSTASPETFTANPVNGGAGPVYQWSVNGSAVGTGATYNYTPANGDIVSVFLTSDAACVSPDTVSTSVAITIASPVTASVSITSIHADTVCTGDTVQFAAVPVNGGTDPTYMWTENGINVATGPYYIYAPHDGDTLTVTMTSNYPCVVTPVVVSNLFIIHQVAPTANSLSVFVSQSSITQGSVDTFTAVASGAGSSPAFQWYINGNPVAGATSAIYTTDSLQPGQIVNCKETSSYACSEPAYVMSGGISVYVTSFVKQQTLKPNSFTLVPNPNNGDFTVNGIINTPGDDKVTIAVTDVLGQTIYKQALLVQNGSMSEHISLARTIARGMYLVTVTTGRDHVVFHLSVE